MKAQELKIGSLYIFKPKAIEAEDSIYLSVVDDKAIHSIDYKTDVFLILEVLMLGTDICKIKALTQAGLVGYISVFTGWWDFQEAKLNEHKARNW
jgi:hypothetical protein